MPTQDRLKGRWPAWYELLPEATLVVGLIAFLVDETDAATSAFESGKAVTLLALGAIAWVAARMVAARLVPWPVARLAAFAAAAIGVLAVVVLPAYDDDTVVETFPRPAPEVPASPAPGGADDPAARPPAASPSPRVVGRGSFRGIDHRATGTVAVYRQPDGRYVVGLEDFDIQPGPDYDLFIVPGADRDELEGAIRLDDLRGNRGTQFYEVPADVDLEDGAWTVLVWCQTFGVPIANATPA